MDERADGTWTAWKLVKETSDLTFDTTDSEEWEAYDDDEDE